MKGALPEKEEVTAIRKQLQQTGCPKKAIRYEVVSALRNSGFTEKVSLKAANPKNPIPRSSYRSYLSRRPDREAKLACAFSAERIIQKLHSEHPCWGSKQMYLYIKQQGNIDVSYTMVKKCMKQCGNAKRVVLIPFQVPKDRICECASPLMDDDPQIVWGWSGKESADKPGERLISDTTCLFDMAGNFIGEAILVWDLWSFTIVGHSLSFMKDDLGKYVHTIKKIEDSSVNIYPGITTIHTDNGKIYLSEGYAGELRERKIIHRISVKGKPTANSVAEALIGQVKREFTGVFIEPARDQLLPFEYWEQTFDQYVKFYNICRIVVKWEMSPLDKLLTWQQSQINQRRVMYGEARAENETPR